MLDRPDLPEPLPWHSRVTIAVAWLTLIVGVFAVIFGILTLAALIATALTAGD